MIKTSSFLLFLILVLFSACKSPVEYAGGPGNIRFDTAFVPVGVKVQYATMRTLQVKWIDTTTKNIKGFILSRSIDAKDPETVSVLDDTIRTYIDTIKEYGSYYYSVRTFTASDTSSLMYKSFYVEDHAPENVSLQRLNTAEIRLSWRDRIPYRHRLLIERQIDTNGFKEFAVKDTGTVSLIESVTGYHSYQYRISAFDDTDKGRTVMSNKYSVIDPIPSEVKVNYFDQEIVQVSWKDAIPFENGFIVEKSINDSPFAELRLVGANDSSIVDTITDISSIRYRVIAVAGNTLSPPVVSNTMAVTKWMPGRPYGTPYSGPYPLQMNNRDILLYSHHGTQQYDYQKREWKKKGDMSANAKLGQAVLLHNGNILSLNGGIGIETPGGLSSVVNEVFDPITGQWHSISSFNSNLLMQNSFTSVLTSDGSVLVFGSVGDHQYNSTKYTAFAERFPPAGESFSMLTSPPRIVLESEGVFLSNNKILITGGVLWKGNTSGQQILTDSCYIYDIASNSWAKGPKMSAPRKQHYCFSMNNADNVMVLGGTSDWFGTSPSTYEVFDSQALTWQPAKNLPEPSVFAVTKISEDTLYAVLGNGSSGSKSLYQFTLSNNGWQKISSLPALLMENPIYVTRLPNKRFILFGNGDSRPLFYLPDFN